MHTVELLEEALALAEGLGYGIRHEWLGGQGGGGCEIAGRKWLFVDLAENATEQLAGVLDTLREEPAVIQFPLTPELAHALGVRRAA